MRLDELTFPERSLSGFFSRQRLNNGNVVIDRNVDGTYDIWGGLTTSGLREHFRGGLDALTAQCVLLDYLARYK